MKIMRLLPVAVLTAALAAAGCGGDIAQQLVSNEQIRTQVFTALASHQDLAFQAVDKFAGKDTLRVMMIDHLLNNPEVAKQVIVRIGTNPQALQYVMQVAMADTAMRPRVMQLADAIEKAKQK